MSGYYWLDGDDEAAIATMLHPMRCMRCWKVHDAGKVQVLGRYTDCSVWKCPNCKVTLDDRPARWGGSAEPVLRQP